VQGTDFDLLVGRSLLKVHHVLYDLIDAALALGFRLFGARWEDLDQSVSQEVYVLYCLMHCMVRYNKQASGFR
jgi:hypothetical protein